MLFLAYSLEQAVRLAANHKVSGTVLKDSWQHRAFVPAATDGDTYLMNLYHDDGQTFVLEI